MKSTLPHFCGDLAAAPDAHGVEVLGQAHVAGLVGQEIFEVLERGDQLALAFFAGDVLDGVADGQHRLGIHDVMEIAVGNGDEIAEPDLVLRAAVMDAHGLGALLEMMVIGLELGLEPLGRRLLAMRFC